MKSGRFSQQMSILQAPWWRPLSARIQHIMHADAVDPPDRRLALLLRGAAAVFGLAVRLRTAAYRHGTLRRRRLACRVVSVGNIAVGGTGKSPMACYVARELRTLGFRTALVSRGYRGQAEKSGGIVSDGSSLRMSAREAGDEPFMLAMRLQPHGVPVVVGRDRFAAGRLALEHFQTEVIVLDDGFQHIRLHREADLVLLDAERPLGNGYLMPRGVLREPPRALSRSDALILTGGDARDGNAERRLSSIVPNLPLFRVDVRPYVHAVRASGGAALPSGDRRRAALADLAGKRVFGFSGIARNDRFRSTLQNAPCRLEGFLGFPDHYDYSGEDLRRICQAASSMGAGWLATTLKDDVRIRQRMPVDIGVIVLDVTLDMGAQTAGFRRFLQRRLQ